MSKRDVRVLLGLAVVFIIAAPFVYRMLDDDAHRAICLQNMRSISSAIQIYASDNDSQLPPAFAEGPGGGYPYVIPNENAIDSWANAISSGMSPRASFKCPAASDEEAAMTLSQRPLNKEDAGDRDREFGQEKLTYGMYAAYSAFPINLVPDPSATVIISETSNMGAMNTFDPVPYTNRTGEVVPFDVVTIGWNNTNRAPNPATNSVSRLAFYDAKDGMEGAVGRHSKGLHAISANGAALRPLKPDSTLLSRSATGITGLWSVPATLGR